jgi:hypothetical protein
LDEATAFSAGHRPCFQCRYKDHQRFKEIWLKGNPQYGYNMKTPIAKMDDIIQSERIAADKSKVTYEANIQGLPNGTFIIYNQRPHLVNNSKLYLWSPGGYSKPVDFPEIEKVRVLTPRSVVNMFSAGYIPQISV